MSGRQVPADAESADGRIPALLRGLCDDAAMFPPGNAEAADAVPAHRGHRAAWYAPLVGPFLVGEAHLAPVAKAPGPGPEDAPSAEAVLIVPGGPRALRPALGDAAVAFAAAGLGLVGVELACAPDGSPAEAAREAVAALDASLPEGAGGVVEVRRGAGSERALDVLAGTPYRAKLRTGGVTAEAFPEPEEVGRFVSGCVSRALAFKCTAGLHQAVRHTDPATGFTHHGFLNILAATSAACAGASAAELVEVLRCRSGAELAADLRTLTPGRTAALRAAFTAYGTCSIAEPLDELVALGLITRPPGQGR